MTLDLLAQIAARDPTPPESGAPDERAHPPETPPPRRPKAPSLRVRPPDCGCRPTTTVRRWTGAPNSLRRAPPNPPPKQRSRAMDRANAIRMEHRLRRPTEVDAKPVFYGLRRLLWSLSQNKAPIGDIKEKLFASIDRLLDHHRVVLAAPRAAGAKHLDLVEVIDITPEDTDFVRALGAGDPVVALSHLGNSVAGGLVNDQHSASGADGNIRPLAFHHLPGRAVAMPDVGYVGRCTLPCPDPATCTLPCPDKPKQSDGAKP